MGLSSGSHRILNSRRARKVYIRFNVRIQSIICPLYPLNAMYICSDLHTLTQISWMLEPQSLSLYFCPLIGSYFSQIYASSSSLWLCQWPLLCQWATSILLSGTSRLLLLYWSSSNTDTNDHSLFEINSLLFTLLVCCILSAHSFSTSLLKSASCAQVLMFFRGSCVFLSLFSMHSSWSLLLYPYFQRTLSSYPKSLFP